MSYNPYQSPQANPTGAETYSTGSEHFTPGIISGLAETKPWVRVFAISSAVSLVSGLVGLFIVRDAGNIVGTVLQLAIGVLLLIKIWQFGSSIEAFVKQPNTNDLRQAMAHQRSYWMIMGILFIIGLAFIIVMAIAGVSMAARR